MVDCGKITWETFLTSIEQILKISDSLLDGWCFKGDIQIEGAAYIVKRATTPLDRFRPVSNSPTEDLENLALDESLESVLKDEQCCEELDNRVIIAREYHVVYSPSYSVPVLYFNSWESNGKLLNLEDTWESVHPSLKPRLKTDKWQTLTQVEHPLLRRPFYQLHPCGTDRLLGCFADVSGNPVVTWLSSVGPVVGLELRGEYCVLTDADTLPRR